MKYVGLVNMEKYTIKPYRWAIFLYIICIIYDIFIFIVCIAFLLVGQLNAIWLSLPTLIINIIIFECKRLISIEEVIYKNGFKIIINSSIRAEFEWNEFEIAYLMRSSYIFPTKFVFLSKKEVPEKRRMIMANLSQIKYKQHKSWEAISIRKKDLQYILDILQEKIVVVNEL